MRLKSTDALWQWQLQRRTVPAELLWRSCNFNWRLHVRGLLPVKSSRRRALLILMRGLVVMLMLMLMLMKMLDLRLPAMLMWALLQMQALLAAAAAAALPAAER